MTREAVLKESEEHMKDGTKMNDCVIHEIDYNLGLIVFTVSGDDQACEISIDEWVSYYEND